MPLRPAACFLGDHPAIIPRMILHRKNQAAVRLQHSFGLMATARRYAAIASSTCPVSTNAMPRLLCALGIIRIECNRLSTRPNRLIELPAPQQRNAKIVIRNPRDARLER